MRFGVLDLNCLRRAGASFLLPVVLSGCDLVTGSTPEPSSIVISPTSVTFDAIGATRSLVAEVRDQDSGVLGEAAVTWTSSGPGIVTVSPEGLVTAVGNGAATITAAAGAASASVNVVVTQLGTALEQVSGDDQLGAAGESLSGPLVVQAYDRLGKPAISVPVEFEATEGGGSLAPGQVLTDSDGRASSTWTLGPLAGESQKVRAFLSFRVGVGVNFEATAVPGRPAQTVIVSGDDQGAPRLSTLSAPLVVRVEDGSQNPIGGVRVEFAVIEGGGSVQPGVLNTDADGLATTVWTLGAPLGDQSVSAAVETLPLTIFSAVATTVPEQVQILDGDGQTGTVGERLSIPPSVQVLGPGAAPVSSLDVRFSISESGGLLESLGEQGAAASLTVRSDSNGVASVAGWILGPAPGTHELTVELPGLVPAVLTAIALTGPPALLAKVSGDEQIGVVGTLLEAPLVVQAADALGNPAPGAAISFGPASAGGSVHPTQTTTGPDGTASAQWILGSTLGPQSVGAAIEAGSAVNFTATATDEAGMSGLAIDLHFIDAPTTALSQAFDDAVGRWRDQIPGKLEPMPVDLAAGACGSGSPAINQVVDDLLVFVTVGTIDGITGILGQAGPCTARLSNGLPITAKMTLDSADVIRLEGTGRLVDLILHELGHALGIGTLWTGMGLLQNPSLPGNKGADTHFAGADAIAAFDAVGGDGYTGGAKVPVENEEGGVGTRDSHWRLSVLTNELMTGFLTGGANPLSRVTVASLGDLGYTVDEDGADPFQLNFVTAPPRETGEPLPLGNDIFRGPIYLLDDKGRVRGALYP